MNRLEGMDDRAFVGISHSLEFLDLEQNNLQRIPKALNQLKRLKYFYIPSNKISEVPDDAFESFSGSLRALSLSGNQLTKIPREALKDCKRLSHLNVGYNQIYDVEEEDFAKWGGTLDTLLLRNNRIARLDAHVFRSTPRLRELSLSFNKLSDVDPEAFTDVANSLENLEVSFGMYTEEFPEEFLKPLKSLLWLALDNNNFRTISQTALYNFGQLQYLNLEANRLGSLPPQVFHPNVHKNLQDIRLSYNHIEVLHSDTFSSLHELRTVVLSGNRIRTVRTETFSSLPNLVTLVISDNKINFLQPRSFTDLPNLIKLDLQNNELKEFALSAFFNVTGFFTPMTINMSRNQIASLYGGDTGTPLHVKTLDLSHNRIPEVPVNFLQSFSDSLRRLNMGYNRIGRLDATAFGNLDLLEVLTLEHNSILTLKKKVFEGIEALQVLDLSHNHIEQLQVEQFSNLENLRIVDLSYNHIRSLPRDVFQNTKLERLDLSHNEFVVMPSSALGEVGFTLRYLDMSHNHVEHLDSTMFPDTPYLLGLNLGHNKLTILPDNVFTSLGGLLKLDLSSNPLRANFKELFHYVQKLRHLSLADTGLKVTPHLPLPKLVTLNLSSNAIEELSAAAVEGLDRLRSLCLNANRFVAVPSQAWSHMPLLKTLDISKNNIKVMLCTSSAVPDSSLNKNFSVPYLLTHLLTAWSRVLPEKLTSELCS
jgi:Leucine-rich repeat (LRR) protein